ncbi:MAG: hypothetical protein ACM3PP_00245 [Candidatus Saccharibacteria bacterium]
MNNLHIELNRRPSMLSAYCGGLLRRRSGLRAGEQTAPITVTWPRYRINRQHLGKFLALTGLSGSQEIPFVYPLVLLFPVHMYMMAHPTFPLQFSKMMQVRTHLVQHRPVHRDEVLDMHCSVFNLHVVSTGMEVDFKTVYTSQGQPVWELVTSYYMPGNYGPAGAHRSHFEPLTGDFEIVQWHFPASTGIPMGHLTGDYNPLHYCAAFARRRGYRRDFAHAQLSLAECIKHLPPFTADRAVNLTMAIKGPVYYSHEVTMKYKAEPDYYRFDLYCGDNPRPSFVASVSLL